MKTSGLGAQGIGRIMSEPDSTASLRVPVLIVGAGPAGLAASLLLRQSGVETLTVSRYNWMAHTPRAHHINPRAMEMLRGLGLEETVRATAMPADLLGNVVWCESLAGDEIGRLRTYHQGGPGDYAGLTPCHAVNISQHKLEPILADALLTRGGKTLFNTECVDLTQTDEVVSVDVRNRVTGQRFRIEADYVIGADGARSLVADRIGLQFTGSTGWGAAINVWIKADLAKFCAHRPGALYWTNQVGGDFWIGSGVFISVTPWNEWIASFMYDPAQGEPDLSEATLRKRVHDIIGDDSIDVEILHAGKWLLNAQYAETYSKGRVLCMGDAVHRHSPANGLGANMSMLDAYNLAWKLKLVLDGVAAPSLLETYGQERQPVGRAIIERSMKSVDEFAEIAVALGYRPGQSAEERRQRLEVFKAPGPDGDAARARVADAIFGARYQFAALGFELGQRYLEGAVLPHEDVAAGNDDPDHLYVPHTAAGIHLPHAALTHPSGRTTSTIDLVGGGAFHLLTGPGGEAWGDACEEIRALTGLEIVVDMIGPGCPHEDAYGDWRRIRGIEDSGALLVRPDGHIAWRAARVDSDALVDLRDGVLALLGRATPGVRDLQRPAASA